MRSICIMGPPGSGKSTQGKILAEKLGVPHVSTGSIFRALEKEKGVFAQRIRSVLSSGGLVEDRDVVKVVGERMKKEDVSKGFVLDGYPRNLSQAVDSLVVFDVVVYLRVSDAVSLKRLLKRGREDDKEAIIKRRLEEYHRRTEPILDFYSKEGILVEVDGERSVDEIASEIEEKIEGI